MIGRTALCLSTLLLAHAQGEVREISGGAKIPHDKYIRMISETESPVERMYIKTRDGLYVAAAMRKPKGEGPFPVLIHFHGAPGGRGMDQLVGWVRGDHGSPLLQRFLQEGFIVVSADYRGGHNLAKLAEAFPADAATYVDDAAAVVEHIRKQPQVDASRINVYGVSLGGDVTMHLLARVQGIHAAVLGAGAPINFLGARSKPDAKPEDRFKDPLLDAERIQANITKIHTPVLVQVGTADSLIHLDRVVYQQLIAAGKRARLEIYENGYHDFVMGPQGQPGRDEPLMDITLKALESSLRWVRDLK
jgi:dipeptidyl aminopeptidase/acylaminoacyl peptidase